MDNATELQNKINILEDRNKNLEEKINQLYTESEALQQLNVSLGHQLQDMDSLKVLNNQLQREAQGRQSEIISLNTVCVCVMDIYVELLS